MHPVPAPEGAGCRCWMQNTSQITIVGAILKKGAQHCNYYWPNRSFASDLRRKLRRFCVSWSMCFAVASFRSCSRAVSCLMAPALQRARVCVCVCVCVCVWWWWWWCGCVSMRVRPCTCKVHTQGASEAHCTHWPKARTRADTVFWRSSKGY